MGGKQRTGCPGIKLAVKIVKGLRINMKDTDAIDPFAGNSRPKTPKPNPLLFANNSTPRD